MKKMINVTMLVASFLTIPSAFAKDQDVSESLAFSGHYALAGGVNCMIGSNILPLLNKVHDVELVGAYGVAAIPILRKEALKDTKSIQDKKDYQQNYVVSGCVDALREAGKFSSELGKRLINAPLSSEEKKPGAAGGAR